MATLTDLAARRNLLQKDLTTRARVDQGTLSKIIAGTRGASPEVAGRLVNSFTEPAARRELIRAYLADVVDGMAINPQEAPLPRRGANGEENLAELLDAALYNSIRELALAAREKESVRVLIAELVRALGPAVTAPAADIDRRLRLKDAMHRSLPRPKIPASRSR